MEKVFIAAGGTGGHINAALSMGEVLEQDFEVVYLTGERYLDFQLFQDSPNVIHLKAYPLRTKNPFKLLINTYKNLSVMLQLVFLFHKDKPRFVIGAGGYVCGPSLTAAKILRRPVFIIEQNAIAGVTNKLLAKFSDLIFVNFRKTKGISGSKKLRVVGNPIRSNIRYSPNVIGDEINLLVFGGSLGAVQINKLVEKLITFEYPFKLKIIHQVGKGNLGHHEIKEERVQYKQVEYIDNMSELYSWSNIIIARAGASTISELRVVKRPAILIPFPYATDNHQYYNAKELEAEDLFYVKTLDPEMPFDNLVQVTRDAIIEIVEDKRYDYKEIQSPNAARAIKKEVYSYVRY